jgi:hypothetical protein
MGISLGSKDMAKRAAQNEGVARKRKPKQKDAGEVLVKGRLHTVERDVTVDNALERRRNSDALKDELIEYIERRTKEYLWYHTIEQRVLFKKEKISRKLNKEESHVISEFSKYLKGHIRGFYSDIVFTRILCNPNDEDYL